MTNLDAIPNNWLNDYYKRSGDSIDDMVVDAEFEINEHGFCFWVINNGLVIALNVYGVNPTDGFYWDNFLEERAFDSGCKKIMFVTRRNPEAFKKRFGYEIKGFVMEREIM